MDLVDAGRVQLAGGDRGQVERPAGGAEARAQVVADLVAARAGAGPERGGDRRLAPARPRTAAPRGQDAAGEPAPAGVDHRDGAGRDERDGQAVGGQRDGGDAGVGGDLAVGVLGRAPPLDGDGRAVDLVALQEAAGRRPAAARRRAVLGHVARGSSSVHGPRFSVA